MNLAFFQKPSRYINSEINSLHREAPVKVALAFPDVYEIGMSHLGLKILYKIINDLPFASAERVFAPWIDLETSMKATGTYLSTLESSSPLKDFDIVGFSLQYELSYTTVLNMLNLGGIPLRTGQRNSSSSDYFCPFIIAGGPCTVNPAPMSPFIDAFVIGDGEEAIQEILEKFYRWKSEGDRRRESFLSSLSTVQGVYVPVVHDMPVRSSSLNARCSLIKKRIVESLDTAPYPDKPVVPYTPIVHDRINIEVSRGCTMGCRFCQAGMIYRPVRERSPHKVLELAERSLKNTGYDEVAFTSLSAGDYSCLLQVVKGFNRTFSHDRISLSLPSLRVASLNRDLLQEIRSVRKTGFTIAPEAATGRLRGVINKIFSDADYEHSLRILFEEGWLNLKLYFMIGLPTEREEDIEGIIQMALKALKVAKQHTKRFVNINVGVSPFVPKAHTPFQWFGQETMADLKRKKSFISAALSKRGLNPKGHDVDMSILEAAFSRGDASLSALIERAWSLGCRLDGWSEVFNFKTWLEAMDQTGLDASAFATRSYDFSDILPWEIIDIGVKKDFLWKEYQNALAGEVTVDCRKVCHNCGLNCKKANEEIPALHNTTGYIPGEPSSSVKVRVEFSKTGSLRYLSHLELMSTIHRALRRAGFPLQYSKGFHPSPKISYGPPLGVGISGLSEYFDIEVSSPFDPVLEKRNLNKTLPEGIYIKEMSVISPKTEALQSFIKRYEYEIQCEDISNVRRFLLKNEVYREREHQTVNLRDMVEDINYTDDNMVTIFLVDTKDCKVRLGEILPVVFDVPMEELVVTRVALYGWDGGWIKPMERSLQWTAKY